jgi:peptide/nickel transport system substrate-binding protein
MDVHVNALGDFTPYFAAMQKGDFDVSISWTNPGPTPYYLYHDMLSSSQTAPIGQAASTNFERWQDPKTDQLLQQYTTSPDAAVQKQAIAGLEKIMVEQLPTIPLTYNPYWNEYRSSRFVGWPDENHPYAVPSPTNYPDNEYIVLQLKPAA